MAMMEAASEQSAKLIIGGSTPPVASHHYDGECVFVWPTWLHEAAAETWLSFRLNGEMEDAALSKSADESREGSSPS